MPYNRTLVAPCRSESINTVSLEAEEVMWNKLVDLETLDWSKQREGRQEGLR